MERKQDMASGGGPTFSGSTPGSKGIGSINSSFNATASVGRHAAKDVGWPGSPDARPENSDRKQSAP